MAKWMIYWNLNATPAVIIEGDTFDTAWANAGFIPNDMSTLSFYAPYDDVFGSTHEWNATTNNWVIKPGCHGQVTDIQFVPEADFMDICYETEEYYIDDKGVVYHSAKQNPNIPKEKFQRTKGGVRATSLDAAMEIISTIITVTGINYRVWMK